MIVNPGSSRLHASTVAIRDPGNLFRYLPADEPGFAFLNAGDGFVAFGQIARFETDSMIAAERWWADLVERIENETEMPGTFGTGPIAIGSFAFDNAHSAAQSVLVVPEYVIGRRGKLSWLTRLGYSTATPQLPPLAPPPAAPVGVHMSDGSISTTKWMDLVASTVRQLDGNPLSKVVLARDLIATAQDTIDPRFVLRRLAQSYGSAYSFMVDGLIGATPEILVRREGGLVTSRVLAGTIARLDGIDDTQQAVRLVTSSKDALEHRLAVRSVADSLAPYLTGMHVPDAPYVLTLPNVMHLATDIVGVAPQRYSTLALAAAMHPTAAVCGTPTEAARAYIAANESLDRGRYAGPVGWMDAQGDGEWGIALRCGQLLPDGQRMRLYAGGGIVSASDPHTELVETEAKFEPMRQALRP